MSPPQDRNRNSCGSETLAKCLQAKKDLETAISGIVKAEQQIKENWREVILNYFLKIFLMANMISIKVFIIPEYLLSSSWSETFLAICKHIAVSFSQCSR